jgi:hypothetical protein
MRSAVAAAACGVRDEDAGGTITLDLRAQQLEHRRGRVGIEVAGRLVREHQRRPVHRARARARRAASRRPRARAASSTRDRRDPPRRAALHTLVGIAIQPLVERQRQRGIGGDAQVRQQVERLEHEPHAAATQQGSFAVVERLQLDAVERNGSRVRCVETRDQVQQRRFADTRFTDDRDVVARLETQRTCSNSERRGAPNVLAMSRISSMRVEARAAQDYRRARRPVERRADAWRGALRAVLDDTDRLSERAGRLLAGARVFALALVFVLLFAFGFAGDAAALDGEAFPAFAAGPDFVAIVATFATFATFVPERDEPNASRFAIAVPSSAGERTVVTRAASSAANLSPPCPCRPRSPRLRAPSACPAAP